MFDALVSASQIALFVDTLFFLTLWCIDYVANSINRRYTVAGSANALVVGVLT